MRTILVVMVMAVVSVASDPIVPHYTQDQRMELLKMERDYLSAFVQAQQTPVCQQPQKLYSELQAKKGEFIQKLGIDMTKWDVDDNTLEFTVKPAEKPAVAEKKQ